MQYFSTLLKSGHFLSKPRDVIPLFISPFNISKNYSKLGILDEVGTVKLLRGLSRCGGATSFGESQSRGT